MDGKNLRQRLLRSASNRMAAIISASTLADGAAEIASFNTDSKLPAFISRHLS
jgi:hypothetical protein